MRITPSTIDARHKLPCYLIECEFISTRVIFSIKYKYSIFLSIHLPQSAEIRPKTRSKICIIFFKQVDHCLIKLFARRSINYLSLNQKQWISKISPFCLQLCIRIIYLIFRKIPTQLLKNFL